MWIKLLHGMCFKAMIMFFYVPAAMEYHNLNTSVATRDFWVITGRNTIISLCYFWIPSKTLNPGILPIHLAELQFQAFSVSHKSQISVLSVALKAGSNCSNVILKKDDKDRKQVGPWLSSFTRTGWHFCIKSRTRALKAFLYEKMSGLYSRLMTPLAPTGSQELLLQLSVKKIQFVHF